MGGRVEPNLYPHERGSWSSRTASSWLLKFQLFGFLVGWKLAIECNATFEQWPIKRLCTWTPSAEGFWNYFEEPAALGIHWEPTNKQNRSCEIGSSWRIPSEKAGGQVPKHLKSILPKSLVCLYLLWLLQCLFADRDLEAFCLETPAGCVLFWQRMICSCCVGK